MNEPPISRMNSCQQSGDLTDKTKLHCDPTATTTGTGSMGKPPTRQFMSGIPLLTHNSIGGLSRSIFRGT
jgi:hypothetical protein